MKPVINYQLLAMKSKYLLSLPKIALFLPLSVAISICTASIGTKVCAQEDGSQGHAMTKEQRDKLSPQDVIKRIKAGNQRFLSGSPQKRDFLQDQAKSAGGQYPEGVVLSCIDSRVPASIVFDTGIGDVFNARVAGNFVNTDIAGSLEYSCKVAGAKVILVMGHSHCGAIKSACDGAELGNITSMLANIKPAVEAVQDVEGKRDSANGKFVEAVAKANVLMTIKKIKEISPVLKEMVDKKEIAIVGCMYDLETGKASFYEDVE
jgi:carbonic anhydrase